MDTAIEIIKVIIPAVITLIGVLTSLNKTRNLLEYRIAQLEKKQDKHNGMMERLAVLERDMDSAQRQLDEIKK